MGTLPRIPGHEVVGEVVAVGEDVKNIKLGETYAGGWHGNYCATCTSCRKGDFLVCENHEINGVTLDGGYAEYCTLYARAAIKVPDGADPAEICCMSCAGVTVFNSVRNMNVPAGALVAVQGIGGLGHLGLQFCKKMGYRVAALSTSPSKKELATSLGADYYLDSSKINQAEELQKLGGADLVLCTAPHPDSIVKIIDGLAPNGILLIVAAMPEPLQLPTLPMISKRIRVQGWPSGIATDSEATMNFALHHDVKCHIEKWALEDADKAFDSMLAGKPRFRAVLIPDYKA